jgi:DNA-binding PadR family transcriptional regulator
MPIPVILGEFEQLVLLAALRLEPECFALPLREAVSRIAGRPVGRGALYRTLDRLADKGLVQWKLAPGPDERGGLARRRFTVTRRGVAALRASRRTLLQLWDGLTEVLE